ncbi:uncharacterized protein EI97DRAFT_429052 [Westerdykella ornata]|uniref:Prion-inhibition and propagation HeLo domain-containing protein n=1 Tax=Westerdykella ornata TaxID=318751 RepID=A0A6A6JWH3_WESOR|nr:uncharacterized protein EI97DRAFT_429052 [Westerdykella ornata]KAF2280961.1 hypothetical protein EI97DRAFT_429052 [Westerdykella ornata]
MPGVATPSSPPAAAPPPPPHTKAQILANVCTLAAQFSSCVEVFNLIHPAKPTDHAQRVALAKLGIQQGRLLIWGDAVGISAPPRTIARSMIPSRPAPTNPDPTLPVPFALRNPRLDEPETYQKVRAALNQIAGRPAYLTREELMAKYGLKSPKRFGPTLFEYPALDTNRLESFREKYSLLQDLARQERGRPEGRRGLSMTAQRWVVQDVNKFCDFISTIKTEVDGLVELMGVKEQVDRGMKSDIRAMGWHPDLSKQAIRQDSEKLRLIREACRVDYPEYIEVTETALKNLGEELREAGEQVRSASLPSSVYSAMAVAAAEDEGGVTLEEEEQERRRTTEEKDKEKEREKSPGFLSLFRLPIWSRSPNKLPQRGTRSTPTTPGPGSLLADEGSEEDKPRQRFQSEGYLTAVRSLERRVGADEEPEHDDELQSERSKSMSAVSDEFTQLRPVDSLLSQLGDVPTLKEEGGVVSLPATNTADKLAKRHDMPKGPGGVETEDTQVKAHDWAEGG